jgi:hypothetical protein
VERTRVTDTPTLTVMRKWDEALDEVPVHADVVALVEAFQVQTGRSMPWSVLLAAAASVPNEHELLMVSRALAGRVSEAVSDAVTDLLDQGLLTTGPVGLKVTERGQQAIRVWNGAYKSRLVAAEAVVREFCGATTAR